jgi:hypothetical protein
MSFFEHFLDEILQETRLSRFFAGVFGVLAVITFVYSLIAPDSLLIGSLIALAFAVLSLSSWKTGNWWAYKKALWKAQEGMPRPNRQRGFEVVNDGRSRRSQ